VATPVPRLAAQWNLWHLRRGAQGFCGPHVLHQFAPWIHHGFLRICQAAGHQLVRCACVDSCDHGSTPFQRLSGRAPCVPSDDGAVTGAKEHQNAEPNTVLTAG
jgi:hypothetical protein